MELLILALPLLLVSALLIQDRAAGRRCYIVYSTVVGVLSLYVLRAFFSQDYGLAWVAKYSDAALSTPLRLAAIWAGQEGTLLLWLCAAVIITWLYPWGRVTKVLLAEQLLLVIGFLLLNPLAKSGISGGIGLNPLLQTHWMLYHPPVVFVGYALLMVPFAEALLGEKLQGKKYLSLGLLFLGAGVALGGFWAYRVLGWGGFWAWDPVEAASLVPLLLVVVAMHVYKSSQGKSLSLWAYVAVTWAVAITRSGVLAESSVHAFAGGSARFYLFLVFALHLAAAVYILVKQGFAREPLPLVWQAISLYALWVAFGTALPALSAFVYTETLSVGPGFYRSGAVPAVVLTLWGLRHSLNRDGTGKGLAHFGVVLFLVGAVASAAFTTTRTVALESGLSEELGSLSVTYTRGEITVFAGDDSIQQDLILRPAEVVKPVIWRRLWEDVYIAPVSVGERGGTVLTISPGESTEYNGDTLELLGMLEGMRLEGHTLVAELLYRDVLVAPLLVVTPDGVKGRKASLPTGGAVALTGVSEDLAEVTLHMYSPEEAEALLVADVSVKPLMNLVRFGVLFMLAGSLLAYWEQNVDSFLLRR